MITLSPEKQVEQYLKTEIAKELDVAGVKGTERKRNLDSVPLFIGQMMPRTGLLFVRMRTVENIWLSEFSFSGQSYSVRAVNDCPTWLATATPDWNSGWGSFLGRTIADDYLVEFVRKCEQYLSRSAFLKFRAGLFQQTDEIACVHNAMSVIWHRVDPCSEVDRGVLAKSQLLSLPETELRDGHQKHRRAVNLNEEERAELSTTLERIEQDVNTLDFEIHRMLFLLLNAEELLDAGFERESATDIWSAVTVAEEFLHQRPTLTCSIHDLVQSDAEADALGLLERARNFLSAHPAQFHWWDIDEILSDAIPQCRQAVWSLFWGLCKLERRSRLVTPYPTNWYEWFLDNVNRLWPAFSVALLRKRLWGAK